MSTDFFSKLASRDPNSSCSPITQLLQPLNSIQITANGNFLDDGDIDDDDDEDDDTGLNQPGSKKKAKWTQLEVSLTPFRLFSSRQHPLR